MSSRITGPDTTGPALHRMRNIVLRLAAAVPGALSRACLDNLLTRRQSSYWFEKLLNSL